MSASVMALAALGVVVLTGAAAYGYFLHAPKPAEPRLSAPVTVDTITVDNRTRSYRAFVPADLPSGAPLLFVLHGSQQDGRTIRTATGYGFDKLAERHKFAVIYPDGYKRGWNDGRTSAVTPARKEEVDDEGLIAALVERFGRRHGVDPARVFVTGFSNGGQMAFRLAARTPERIAAIAVIGAGLPTPDQWAVTEHKHPLPVLLIAGTRDPIMPYEGGEASIFGFQKRGTVRSAEATARAFADVNGITRPPIAWPPTESPLDGSGGTEGAPSVIETRYSEPGKNPVVAFTVSGGGHTIPNPDYRFPRLMGRTDDTLNSPAAIWDFFSETMRADTPPHPR
ncbi:alpha/beta hydrolase family esterase [Streptomyces pseudovenezuelae]|uniref:Polyhydroxybutyrate depolymerase n=1 Tax=Streptomyces pseudovenezuelae TaxID=67350 RepID=A0ABT6LP43_9ACTN|nr:PHB depolymerase family esterase [Streptomyces pseudovenezuelae]MDH6218075.1 polyhydroxybutyrate depolymerase [Streptomyces pseudovenezuelae]